MTELPARTTPGSVYEAPRRQSVGGLTRLDELEAVARERLHSRWPDVPSFDDVRWPHNPNKPRFSDEFSTTLVFEGFRYPRRMSRDLERALKAFLILTDQQARNALHLSLAVRRLWDAAVERRAGVDVDRLTLAGLEPEDFDRAIEHSEAQDDAPATTYNTVARAAHFIAWAEQKGALPVPLGYENPLPNPTSVAQATHAGRAARLKKLPTAGALRGLATIYHRATDPGDRLLICLVGLIALTGLRLREALTLRADALFSEEHDGRIKWGVRFSNEKTRGTEQKYAVRWLSPLAAALAQALWRELLAITEPARQQARVLRAAGGYVRLPLPDDVTEIARQDVAALVYDLAIGVGGEPGKSGLLTATHCARLKIACRQTRRAEGGTGQLLLARADVERWLTDLQPPLDRDLGHGDVLPLEDALSIAPPAFFTIGAGTQPRRPMRLLVVPVAGGSLSKWLGNKPDRAGRAVTVYARFDLREKGPTGEDLPCRMNAHQLRHWINTLAHKAGMSAFYVTMWMQRSDPEQTALYLHDAADMATLTRERLLLEEMWGDRADEVAALPPEERDGHLAVTLPVAHGMEEGTCVAPFHLAECDQEGNCGPACPNYLHRLGDRSELTALRRRRDSFAVAAEYIAELRATGVRVVAAQEHFYQCARDDFDALFGLSEAHGGAARAVAGEPPCMVPLPPGPPGQEA